MPLFGNHAPNSMKNDCRNLQVNVSHAYNNFEFFLSIFCHRFSAIDRRDFYLEIDLIYAQGEKLVCTCRTTGD